MPATTRNIASLIMLLGLADVLADLDEPAASTDAPTDVDSEQPDEAENAYHRHASDDEARAAFFAENRREIEDEAVAVVALMPSADGELRARVLHTTAACAFGQAIALRDVADQIAASHNPAVCAARRLAKARNRN